MDRHFADPCAGCRDGEVDSGGCGTADHGLNQEDAGCQLEAPGVTRLPGTLRVTGIKEAVAGSTASWTCMRWREVLAAQTAQEC